MEPYGVCRVEDFVRTCDFEAPDVIIAAYSVAGRVDSHPCSAVLEPMAFVARTFYRKLLLVISLVQHQIAQAFSGCGFVGRVDIEAFVRFHEIVRADDAAVRNPFDGLSLSLAQKRCLALFRRISVFVWSDLDAIERYVADCDLYNSTGRR